MSIKLVVFGMAGTKIKDGYWMELAFQQAMPGFSAERSRIGQVNSGLNNISRY